MTTLVQVALLLTLLAEPLLALAVELRAHLHARRGAPVRSCVVPVSSTVPPVTDLTVLVPVTGLHDLDGLAWLHGQGRRVLLVAAAADGRALHRRLWQLADAHGFRVHVCAGGRRPAGGPDDADGGRRRLLLAAHAVVTSTYVLCVDPSAVVGRRPEQVVGALVAAGLDVATLTVTTAPSGLPGRVQRVEDALAARWRHHAPWLVRGGVLVARRTVHVDLLRRGAGTGRSGAIEPAVLAAARGRRVGHLTVPVRGPRDARAWGSRQVAQATEGFRLAVVHLPLGMRLPVLGAAAGAYALAPLLWWSVLHVPSAVLPVLLVHGALTRTLVRDGSAWLYPLHALLRVLVVLPLGVVAYVVTAGRTGSAGLLRVRDGWTPEPEDLPLVRRLPGPGPARATDWWAPR